MLFYIKPTKSRRKTDHSDAWLHDWFSSNMPHAKSFWMTDCDLILRDRNGNLMLLELKCKMAQPKTAQLTTMRIINGIIVAGLKALNNVVRLDGRKYPINYHGYHLIQFEYVNPDDGAIFLDGMEVTKDELIRFLSFDIEMLNFLK